MTHRLVIGLFSVLWSCQAMAETSPEELQTGSRWARVHNELFQSALFAWNEQLSTSRMRYEGPLKACGLDELAKQFHPTNDQVADAVREYFLKQGMSDRLTDDFFVEVVAAVQVANSAYVFGMKRGYDAMPQAEKSVFCAAAVKAANNSLAKKAEGEG